MSGCGEARQACTNNPPCAPLPSFPSCLPCHSFLSHWLSINGITERGVSKPKRGRPKTEDRKAFFPALAEIECNLSCPPSREFAILVTLYKIGKVISSEIGNRGKVTSCTELGERTVPRLRELAPCGQRESGGGIHAP